MSEYPGGTFEESWGRQVRTARLILAGCVLAGIYLAWYGRTRYDADLSIAVIGALCGIFGIGGLLLLWRSAGTGLRFDDTGITVRLPKGPMTFRWDEIGTIELWVRIQARPGYTPKVLRSSTFIELRLAPLGRFADRPGLAGLRLVDAAPYTHRIRVPSTGPLAGSEERIGQLDAALRAIGGAKYAGINRNA